MCSRKCYISGRQTTTSFFGGTGDITKESSFLGASSFWIVWVRKFWLKAVCDPILLINCSIIKIFSQIIVQKFNCYWSVQHCRDHWKTLFWPRSLGRSWFAVWTGLAAQSELRHRLLGHLNEIQVIISVFHSSNFQTSNFLLTWLVQLLVIRVCYFCTSSVSLFSFFLDCNISVLFIEHNLAPLFLKRYGGFYVTIAVMGASLLMLSFLQQTHYVPKPEHLYIEQF